MMKVIRLDFCVFFIATTVTLVSSLNCSSCSLRVFDYYITPDKIPDFSYCTTNITTQKFCSLNFYSDDNRKTSKLRAYPNDGIEHVSVPYILAGFDVPKDFNGNFGMGLLYQCLTDNCNHPQTILKRILQATTIETYQPVPLLSSSEPPTCFTYNNFTSIDICRPSFRRDQSSRSNDSCSTYCVTSIRIDATDLKTERLCAYCEQQPMERFTYIDERVFLLNERTSRLQQLEFVCNSSSYCNSLENIRKIQQQYKIEFDFDKFDEKSAATMLSTSILGYFLLFYIVDITRVIVL
ncbi:unnamed protein product [Adineta ricciae]|uniref:Uncharacterized protein n=1 Tax=Adineta ricciae TaxID=249248 RepID=A0A815JUG6_ADIRI|nr:unnamed protein product [Adineta ricciae]